MSVTSKTGREIDEHTQQRVLYAERHLSELGWPAEWSRDDQLQAYAEGWALSIFIHPQIHIAGVPKHDLFTNDHQATSYVIQRAHEGSELHQRAVAIHTATTLAGQEL